MTVTDASPTRRATVSVVAELLAPFGSKPPNVAVAVALASLPSAALAQSDLITVTGNSRGNNFGYSVANAGDVDNDGVCAKRLLAGFAV